MLVGSVTTPVYRGTLLIQGKLLVNAIAVAMKVAVQVSDIARNQSTTRIVPRSIPDPVTRIHGRFTIGGLGAFCTYVEHLEELPGLQHLCRRSLRHNAPGTEQDQMRGLTHSGLDIVQDEANGLALLGELLTQVQDVKGMRNVQIRGGFVQQQDISLGG